MTKSQADYAHEIALLTNALQVWDTDSDFISGVIKDAFKRKTAPTRKQVESMLYTRKNEWIKHLDVEVLVANNEQKPWSADEIGLPTIPMPTLKEMHKRGIESVGQACDYAVRVDGTLLRFGVERKSMSDYYSTLMGRHADGTMQRARLYREFDRAKVMFDSVYIFVEGTEKEFLAHKPKRTKMKNESWDDFNKRNKSPGASVESRLATVRGIQARGVHVVYHARREDAAKALRTWRGLGCWCIMWRCWDYENAIRRCRGIIKTERRACKKIS
ncbi:MAG: hypothetical protein KAJ03_01590 [Gammaproteobacteria bacterium]|nr:hypothetical protein [Gammaproteobacteria bacterium]